MVPQHEAPPDSAVPYRLSALSAIKPLKGVAPSAGGPLKAWSTVKVWASAQHARANIIQMQVRRTAIVVKAFLLNPQCIGCPREHRYYADKPCIQHHDKECVNSPSKRCSVLTNFLPEPSA